MFSHNAGGRLFHTAGPLYAKLRCPVEVWTRGSRTVECSELTRTAFVGDHRHPPLKHKAFVDMSERRRWHTSTQLRRTWKWLVVILVANVDHAVLARRGHGVELLTQGELQHSEQPGVASSVHPLLRSLSHCSSPDNSGQKPEQGITEHPLSAIAGQRAADVAGRNKNGIQQLLPPAPA